MSGYLNIQWSQEVNQARWISERLAPFDSGLVTSVIPSGFESYARLLHPAEDTRNGKHLVRWRDVAEWSGLGLVPGVQFHEIALPEREPEGPAPWNSQGPEVGTLSASDARAAVEVLARHTTTPEHCWFCLWDGYGWEGAAFLSGPNDDHTFSLEGVLDPIPAEVRSGPRVALPNRNYFLYKGPIGVALAFVDSKGQTPNLWWPDDRAWCIASEIDLPWTYVGGSSTLVANLVAEPRIEAQRTAKDENVHSRATGWMAQAIATAVSELFESGTTVIETSRGTIHAELDRPQPTHWGCLRTSSFARNGVTGHGTTMLPSEQLREHLSSYLTIAVIALVSG